MDSQNTQATPGLTPGMARIRVKNLMLRTYIGINEDEVRNKQDVLINLTIVYPAADAVSGNQIEQALNYRTVTKAIISHVEDYAEVEVDKPHALRFAESVSITLSSSRNG